MKVLFVSSGNIKKFGISPIVVNQAKSLRDIGIEVINYGIKGNGWINYLKSTIEIRKLVGKIKPDVIHAHYSFTAFITTLAKKNKPLVVSLMGSDSQAGLLLKLIIKFFNIFFWKVTIVKSDTISDKLKLKQFVILPNGVDFNLFKPIDKYKCRRQLSLDLEKKIVIFISDPLREEKNIELAKKSIELANKKGVYCELLIVFGKEGIDHDMIPVYINAADTLILTSKHEGSPNVVKEAMACNCPVVATDVGDIKKIIGNTFGCFVTSFKPEDISQSLITSIKIGKTDGRSSIAYLESTKIATKLKNIYSEIV